MLPWGELILKKKKQKKFNTSFNVLVVVEYSKHFKTIRANSKEEAASRCEEMFRNKQKTTQKQGMFLGDFHVITVKENVRNEK